MHRNKAFTLVEIMIVVAIIGLLAAIAIPSFIKARQQSQTNACINNLRQIDAAKEQWALANKAVNNDIVNTDPAAGDSVWAYVKSGEPSCPADGAYTIGVVGTPPTCDVTGHVLP